MFVSEVWLKLLLLSILLAGSYAGHSLSLVVGMAGASLPGPWAGELVALFAQVRCAVAFVAIRLCVWRLFMFGSGRCLGSTYVHDHYG